MQVSAIIPAYNEEKTIADVVVIAKNVPFIREVIVVCDGCTDNTAHVAARAGARVIELQDNLGKGGAMMVGVSHSEADFLLFLDADLVGLKVKHLVDLIEPVVLQEAVMSLGIFSKGRTMTDLAQVLAPYLTGQRCLVRNLLTQLPGAEISRFGVEVALTNYVRKQGLPIKRVNLPDMTHVMKEEKLGLVRGFGARMRMYWEIAKCLVRG